jgi:hypothetical protein
MQCSSKLTVKSMMRKTGCTVRVQRVWEKFTGKIFKFYLTKHFLGGELYKQLEMWHHPYTIFHLQIAVYLHLKNNLFPILTYAPTLVTLSFRWLCVLSQLILSIFSYFHLCHFLLLSSPKSYLFWHPCFTWFSHVIILRLSCVPSVTPVSFSKQFWPQLPVTLFTYRAVGRLIDPQSVSDCVQWFSENSPSEWHSNTKTTTHGNSMIDYLTTKRTYFLSN